MANNRVELRGNLGRDPELKTTASGKKVAVYSIGVSRGAGEQKTTEWFNIVAFDEQADQVMKNLKKGSYVVLDGILKPNSYEKDGVKVNTVSIIQNDYSIKPPRETKEETGSTLDELPF